ncbi:MAG: 1-deoxy-D-xylulose-5-phosphate reductoisomerase, partial [Verrucomicrobiota bacterium]
MIREHRDKLDLIGIAGRSRWKELAQIADEFEVPEVALYDEDAWVEANREGNFPKGTKLRSGLQGLRDLVMQDGVDLVVAALVGTAGLQPVLAALKNGTDVALANKEILVMAGRFMIEAADRSGARILPADSEHNALFQCLDCGRREEIARLILTASGGAFRDLPKTRLKTVKVADALKHPTWEMGAKVTVDSATMANKGLELIEARWLFDMAPEQLDVTLHPESIVHSMAEFVDGSILAQLSPPSMTFPLQHCLLFPERHVAVERSLDFSKALTLNFKPVDEKRYPCLRLAREALAEEKDAAVVFNAANEVAVQAFLDEQVGFLDIPKIIEKTLTKAKLT